MVDPARGDVVRLRSGGPAMTVSTIDKDVEGGVQVHCEWFDVDELKGAWFPEESLSIVESSDMKETD